MNWILKKFDELLPAELYAILQLRSEVFVIEQDCVFQDMDNKDQQCLHLMGWQHDVAGSNQLIAYTRLVPPGVAYSQPSIAGGNGRVLMEKSIEEVYRLFGKQPIKIGAQLYLQKFYASLGFIKTSGIYLEDNIEHIEMIKE
jgi:ElaA protein